MKFLMLILLIISNAVKASFFDVPLRSFEINSRLKVASSVLNQISAPNTVYIQDGKVQFMGVDELRPYCSISKMIPTTPDGEEFESFKLESLEGAYVFDSTWSIPSNFKTTLSLTGKNQIIDISCFNPISEKQRVEELNISSLTSIMGDLINIEKILINPGNFQTRFAPQITNKLIIHELKIELHRDITLVKDENIPRHFEARLGDCFFFSTEGKTQYNKDEILTVNSYELTYHKESLYSQNPSIILRFSDSDGIMCESKAEKRMFDYQDFWDATGKDDISWVISI